MNEVFRPYRPEGARRYYIHRPYGSQTEPEERGFHIIMPPELSARFHAVARQFDMSRKQLLEQAVRFAFAHLESSARAHEPQAATVEEGSTKF